MVRTTLHQPAAVKHTRSRGARERRRLGEGAEQIIEPLDTVGNSSRPAPPRPAELRVTKSRPTRPTVQADGRRRHSLPDTLASQARRPHRSPRQPPSHQAGLGGIGLLNEDHAPAGSGAWKRPMNSARRKKSRIKSQSRSSRSKEAAERHECACEQGIEQTKVFLSKTSVRRKVKIEEERGLRVHD